MTRARREEVRLEMVRRGLSYTREEMAVFLSHEKNRELLETYQGLHNLRLRFAVVKAHGCFCRHTTGQVIVVNGDGSLHRDGCPEKTCIHLLHSMTPLVWAAQEFVCAGMPPDRLKFRHAGCVDAGVMCGGVGNVAVELLPDEGGHSPAPVGPFYK